MTALEKKADVQPFERARSAEISPDFEPSSDLEQSLHVLARRRVSQLGYRILHKNFGHSSHRYTISQLEFIRTKRLLVISSFATFPFGTKIKRTEREYPVLRRGPALKKEERKQLAELLELMNRLVDDVEEGLAQMQQTIKDARSASEEEEQEVRDHPSESPKNEDER